MTQNGETIYKPYHQHRVSGQKIKITLASQEEKSYISMEIEAYADMKFTE